MSNFDQFTKAPLKEGKDRKRYLSKPMTVPLLPQVMLRFLLNQPLKVMGPTSGGLSRYFLLPSCHPLFERGADHQAGGYSAGTEQKKKSIKEELTFEKCPF
jgi:hypothetical protein